MAAQEATLVARDGIELSAVHLPFVGPDPLALAVVVAPGFTNNWRLPRVEHVIERLGLVGGVVAVDLRGHGDSTGRTTLGDTEIMDVSAAVRWARDLGYRSVVTVGFSMGGSVVVRQAALEDEPVDAVVSVSAPAFWYYKGTSVMRWVHRIVENPFGRTALRAKNVRVTSQEWQEPMPMQPFEAVRLFPDLPFLVVHGTVDHYFPVEHAKALHQSAVESGNVHAELMIVPGMAHAESAVSDQTLDAIGAWIRDTVVVS